MSAELLTAIVSIGWSLCLSYLPGVKDWWEGLTTEQKQAGTGLMILASAGGVYAVSCYTDWFGLACPDTPTILASLLTALVASQGMHKLTKG